MSPPLTAAATHHNFHYVQHANGSPFAYPSEQLSIPLPAIDPSTAGETVIRWQLYVFEDLVK